MSKIFRYIGFFSVIVSGYLFFLASKEESFGAPLYMGIVFVFGSLLSLFFFMISALFKRKSEGKSL